MPAKETFPSGESAPFPERLGRYELLLPLASGGMATVFLARAKGPGGFERDVALKLTHAHLRHDPSFSIEVLDEASLAARIRHPNVVSVIEVGDDARGVFLVMEYIEGDTLAGLVRRGEVPLRTGARILLDALAGLHAAHELTDAQGAPLGLVHRDFSPQNLLVGVDGVTRLADFGVAKAASRVAHTTTGVVKGKVSYMSPEQARGLPLDRRSDLWAAGVVAWEIVAGRRLFPHEGDGIATLLKVVSEVPPRLRHVCRGVDPDLDEAVAAALDSRVEARPRTAAEFRATLAESFRRGAGIAETDEVAARVGALLSDELAERRAKVEAVLEQREEARRTAVQARVPEAVTAEPITPTVTALAVSPPAQAARSMRWAFAGLGLAAASAGAWALLRPAVRASSAAEAVTSAAPAPAAVTLETAEPLSPATAEPAPSAAPLEAPSAKPNRRPAPPAPRVKGPSLLPSPYEKR